MGNCLKTQLKEVVNNDNLVKLGYIRIKNAITTGDGTRVEGFALQLNASTASSVEMHNATQTYDVYSWTARDAWVDVKKNVLRGIYTYGTSVNYGTIYLNIEDLAPCSALERLTLTSNASAIKSYGNIYALQNMPLLKKFEVNNNTSIFGNVAKIPQLSQILTHVSIAGTGISGDANCFVSNGSLVAPLQVLEFGGPSELRTTPITFNVSNIVICANSSCTVYIKESQIIWDTMTKAEFQSIIDSLPTKPNVSWNA